MRQSEKSNDDQLVAWEHDSGLLSLYMMLSNTGYTGVYQKMSNQQLNDRDLQE
ncbi:MAG: hypothetical protein ACLFUB_20495 [Cyclobacteriaceae bacterium]